MSHPTTKPPAAGEAAHTPTPWTIRNGSHYDYIYSPVESANGIRTFVARLPDDEQGKRDAAFIIRACNSYEALGALAKELELIDPNNVLAVRALQKDASAILAKASAA